MYDDLSAPNGLKMRATGLVRAYFNLRIENTGVGIGLEIKFFKACTFHKKKDQRNGIILLKFHPCLIYYLHISYITRICRWKSWPHRIAAAIEYTDSWRMYVCVCSRVYMQKRECLYEYPTQLISTRPIQYKLCVD